eukprot:jgi/Tetstr1/458463/TSEL_004318.t1
MARERHFLNFPNCSHSLKRAAKLRRKAALSQAAAAGAAAAAATTTGAAAGVAAAVGNGPPAPVSDDGGSKVDDVMGVGEDPVGEDGSGKVTVQSGWVMEDCLHHMETFSILNAGPLLEEARVKAIMTEKELRVPRRWTRSLGRGGLDTQRGAKARRPGQRGAKARRPGQRGAKARRPGQRGANASGMGGAAVATE